MQKDRNKWEFNEWKLTFLTLCVLANRIKVIYISEAMTYSYKFPHYIQPRLSMGTSKLFSVLDLTEPSHISNVTIFLSKWKGGRKSSKKL